MVSLSGNLCLVWPLQLHLLHELTSDRLHSAVIISSNLNNLLQLTLTLTLRETYVWDIL